MLVNLSEQCVHNVCTMIQLTRKPHQCACVWREQVIVYPTQDSMKRFGALISLLTVWLVSLLLASPLAVFNVLNAFEPFESIVLYETCVENLDLETQRRAYSLASIVFQYLLPVVIVSVAHARISHKLRSRMVTLQQRNAPASTAADSSTAASGGRRHRRHAEQSTSTAASAEMSVRATVTMPLTAAQKEKRRLALQRKRKTNLLLVMIAVVFALSWLPLNVCNIVADFDIQLLQRFDTQVIGTRQRRCWAHSRIFTILPRTPFDGTKVYSTENARLEMTEVRGHQYEQMHIKPVYRNNKH